MTTAAAESTTGLFASLVCCCVVCASGFEDGGACTGATPLAGCYNDVDLASAAEITPSCSVLLNAEQAPVKRIWEPGIKVCLALSCVPRPCLVKRTEDTLRG